VSALALLLLLAAAGAAEETPFEDSKRTFSDAAACKAFLAGEVAQARGGSFDAVEGPYLIAAGDVRMHTVQAVGVGHRIHEQRCLAEKLSGRSWTHAMVVEEEEFTVESVARNAPWLKKDGR
jgi:hypothetical protein